MDKNLKPIVISGNRTKKSLPIKKSFKEVEILN